jgi:hypothetical protein
LEIGAAQVADWPAHLYRRSRQFRATVKDDDAGALGLMIKKRLPSGERSQLKGPVRIPVSTISLSNKVCGVPAWKTGLVLTGTAVIFESAEM